MGGDAEQPRHRLSAPHPRRAGRQPGEGHCRLRGGAHGHERARPCRASGRRRRTTSASPIGAASAAIGPTTWRRPLPPMRRRSRSARARPCPRVGGRRRTTSALPIWTASAATGPTTWRRQSPPTRRRSRSARARPCRASGRRRRTTSAIAYRDRIRGDRADNLEKAIAAYEAALTVRTREALPREWARDAEQPRHRLCATASAAIGPATWRRRLPPIEAALTVFTREALPARSSAHRRGILGSALTRSTASGARPVGLCERARSVPVAVRPGARRCRGPRLIAEAGPLFAEAAFAAASVGKARRRSHWPARAGRG